MPLPRHRHVLEENAANEVLFTACHTPSVDGLDGFRRGWHRPLQDDSLTQPATSQSHVSNPTSHAYTPIPQEHAPGRLAGELSHQAVRITGYLELLQRGIARRIKQTLIQLVETISINGRIWNAGQRAHSEPTLTTDNSWTRHRTITRGRKLGGTSRATLWHSARCTLRGGC